MHRVNAIEGIRSANLTMQILWKIARANEAKPTRMNDLKATERDFYKKRSNNRNL